MEDERHRGGVGITLSGARVIRGAENTRDDERHVVK